MIHLVMKFLTKVTQPSNPASKFNKKSREWKNLRDHSNLNASEVIPQPCISLQLLVVPMLFVGVYEVSGEEESEWIKYLPGPCSS